MKTLLIYLIITLAALSLILLLAYNCPAADFHGYVQIGYIQELESFETEIKLNITEWNRVTFYISITVLMEYYEKVYFMPYRDTYSIGMTLDLTHWLYVDLYHHCAHPVYSNYTQFYNKFAGGNMTRISTGLKW